MDEKSIVSKSKKKMKQFIFSRMFIIILLLIVQIAFFVVLWKFKIYKIKKGFARYNK